MNRELLAVAVFAVTSIGVACADGTNNLGGKLELVAKEWVRVSPISAEEKTGYRCCPACDTKKRGEVSGGGRKPYRQKGTGRARQGSTRSPQFRGGGVVFGPHPRSYAQRLPRQMRRLALCGALTSKLDDDAIRVVEGFGLEGPRTRDLVSVLEALGRAEGKVLIVAPGTDETLILSARNLPGVEVIRADSLNVVSVLDADTVLIEQPALTTMQEVYA